ncbi:MAG: hypothetical protein C0501_14325 [Isosphaera sp.]|nr:hypothetical protein [Isosphaera sp.]
MIRIHGSVDGAEAEAARQLRDIIVAQWPWAETDPRAEFEIVAGVKCYNQVRARDLDIVLLASVPEDRGIYHPFLEFAIGGSHHLPDDVRVDSLCLVIEIKDHEPGGVRFEGTHAKVTYKGVWSSATDQNDQQLHSLRNYLGLRRGDPPWVTNLIWFRQIDRADLPNRPHNLIGADPNWELMLNVVAQLSPPWREPGGWVLRAWPGGAAKEFDRVVARLTQLIEPTRLDRMRMDLITRRAVADAWIEDVGRKQVAFRGQGGTGKTMLLLQLAWRAVEQGDRVLLLTYNLALVADLQRLLALLGVADAADRPSLRVLTIHSYLGTLFGLLGLSLPEVPPDERHDAMVTEISGHFAQGTLTAADYAQLKARYPEEIAWDHVFVDEAQDWPPAERDLLRRLFPPSATVLAEGPEQLVRTQSACNWQEGITRANRVTIQRVNCLRMKQNLVRFANELAFLLNAPGAAFVPEEQATGGRVLILEGDYFADPNLHTRLLADNATAGNQPIDMLACVPPAMTFVDSQGEKRSTPAQRFAAVGQDVWDGVNPAVRRTYPVSTQSLRVVQYDSCRGLEGWTVLALGFDEFYRYKLSEGANAARPDTPLSDDPAAPARYAGRWLLIALSRTIDTLVLQVSDTPGPLLDALRHLADQFPDFVERRVATNTQPLDPNVA